MSEIINVYRNLDADSMKIVREIFLLNHSSIGKCVIDVKGSDFGVLLKIEVDPEKRAQVIAALGLIQGITIDEATHS